MGAAPAACYDAGMSMHVPSPDDAAAAQRMLAWSLARLAHREAVLPPAPPAVLPELSARGIGIAAAMEHLLGVVLPTAVPPDHPRYLAFIPGAPTVASAIADMALSAAMVYGGSQLEAGLAVQAEDAVIRWLADLIGYPASAGGTFVSGGSIATLSALVAARADRYLAGRRQVIVGGASGHASIAAAARIMGCGFVAAPPADDYGRLTGATLEAALAALGGDEVIAVAATAGATNNGAVDDLAGLAAVCRERGLWLHVDGAYGGAALLSEQARHLFAGLEAADSFIVDPHKWLYAPFDCAAVLYRDAAGARRRLPSRQTTSSGWPARARTTPPTWRSTSRGASAACRSGSRCWPTAGTPTGRPSTSASRWPPTRPSRSPGAPTSSSCSSPS